MFFYFIYVICSIKKKNEYINTVRLVYRSMISKKKKLFILFIDYWCLNYLINIKKKKKNLKKRMISYRNLNAFFMIAWMIAMYRYQIHVPSAWPLTLSIFIYARTSCKCRLLWIVNLKTSICQIFFAWYITV